MQNTNVPNETILKNKVNTNVNSPILSAVFKDFDSNTFSYNPLKFISNNNYFKIVFSEIIPTLFNCNIWVPTIATATDLWYIVRACKVNKFANPLTAAVSGAKIVIKFYKYGGKATTYDATYNYIRGCAVTPNANALSNHDYGALKTGYYTVPIYLKTLIKAFSLDLKKDGLMIVFCSGKSYSASANYPAGEYREHARLNWFEITY